MLRVPERQRAITPKVDAPDLNIRFAAAQVVLTAQAFADLAIARFIVNGGDLEVLFRLIVDDREQTEIAHQLWGKVLPDEALVLEVAHCVMIEWLTSHTNVVYQPPVGHRAYSGINPYALGFAMYNDIKRICESPTDEDRAWFPELAGQDWLETIDHAMRNFKDESFVGQYLSPQLMRNFRLFSIVDDESEKDLKVAAIHDEAGYRQVRESLSRQYDLGSREPNIQVWSVNLRGDRSLTLRHTQHNQRPLHDDGQEVLKHVARLWGFGTHLESVNGSGTIAKRWSVPAPTD